jgi:3-hydroxyacyl-[acyl-carrier-protein] dehydratase
MRWFWVDRFTEYVAGSHAVGHKGVTLSDEFMHDHWESYPVMPNTLIAEGMAQTAGLLVSELYDFKELVVLAKFTKLEFDGLVRPGDTLTYRAEIGARKEIGAQAAVVGTIDGRQQSSAEIFFARMQAGMATQQGIPTRLFDPEDLVHWLQITDVFKVGVREDGSRMHAKDYGLPVYA